MTNERRIVYILGAGVDRAFGLPLANDLIRELGAFETTEGSAISKAIKAKLGGGNRVRFSFEKFRANQGEGFAERVMTDSILATNLQQALTKLENSGASGANAVKPLLDGLRRIKSANELGEEEAVAIAKLSGESANMADYTILRTRGMALSPAPRNAIVRIFRDIQSADGLNEDEVKSLDSLVEAMTNFEELLAEKFAGFYSGNPKDISTYLYISWLLWAYLRWKTTEAQGGSGKDGNFYDVISPLPSNANVITFNYTDLGNLPQERTIRFHGDCRSYIRSDSGQLILDDDAVAEANDLESIRAFIENLDIDIDQRKVFVPAIVPPSTMKPVINPEFINRWSRAESLLREADTLIVVGYAFNRVDSHFNELFRSNAPGKRVVIINPDLESSRTTVCNLLNTIPTSLTRSTLAGVNIERSDGLTFVPVNAESVEPILLERLATAN